MRVFVYVHFLFLNVEFRSRALDELPVPLLLLLLLLLLSELFSRDVPAGIHGALFLLEVLHGLKKGRLVLLPLDEFTMTLQLLLRLLQSRHEVDVSARKAEAHTKLWISPSLTAERSSPAAVGDGRSLPDLQPSLEQP